MAKNPWIRRGGRGEWGGGGGGGAESLQGSR